MPTADIFFSSAAVSDACFSSSSFGILSSTRFTSLSTRTPVDAAQAILPSFRLSVLTVLHSKARPRLLTPRRVPVVAFEHHRPCLLDAVEVFRRRLETIIVKLYGFEPIISTSRFLFEAILNHGLERFERGRLDSDIGELRVWAAHALTRRLPLPDAALMKVISHLRDPDREMTERLRWIFLAQRPLGEGVQRALASQAPDLAAQAKLPLGKPEEKKSDPWSYGWN